MFCPLMFHAVSEVYIFWAKIYVVLLKMDFSSLKFYKMLQPLVKNGEDRDASENCSQGWWVANCFWFLCIFIRNSVCKGEYK